MNADTQAQTWYLGSWGLWGWLETIVKLIASVIGYIAFAGAVGTGSITLGGHPHLAAVILLAIATLIAVGLIALRIKQHEIIGIVYSILNALGHIAILIALLMQPTATTYPILFGVIYALGEVVKIRFLQVSGFTERGQTSAQMVKFSGAIVAAYVIYVILLLI